MCRKYEKFTPAQRNTIQKYPTHEKIKSRLVASADSPFMRVEEVAVGSLDAVQNPSVLWAHCRRSSELIVRACVMGQREGGGVLDMDVGSCV